MDKNLSLNFLLGMRSELGRIPTILLGSARIPTIPLGSTRNVWGRVKYCLDRRGPHVVVSGDKMLIAELAVGGCNGHRTVVRWVVTIQWWWCCVGGKWWWTLDLYNY